MPIESTAPSTPACLRDFDYGEGVILLRSPATSAGSPKESAAKAISKTTSKTDGRMTGIAFDDQHRTLRLTDYDRNYSVNHVSCSGCRDANVRIRFTDLRSAAMRRFRSSRPAIIVTALTGEGDSPAILFEC